VQIVHTNFFLRLRRSWSADAIRWMSAASLTGVVLCTSAGAHAQVPPSTPSPAAPTAPAAAEEPIAAPESSPPEGTTAPADPPPAAAAPAAPPPPPPPPAAAAAPAAGPFAEKVAHELPKGDATSLSASGGGAISSGNTRSYQVNIGADFQLIRFPHGVSANAAFAYGLARVPELGDELQDTARNINAKARYDYFLSQMDALFLATAFRWDPFAGIDRRNQGQVGYLRYFLREDNHRFWGELGYDLTSDDYGLVEGEEDPTPPDPESEVIHSVRLFAGYDNKLNNALTYVGGLEGLINVEEPGDSRLAFTNALQSAIAESFRLELKLSLIYDSKPNPVDAEELDTTFLVNLIYQMI
jgi:putative salt-induced outer membrane protein YdiY